MTDNKYQNGKIYKIVSDQTDKIYVGSTVQKRLSTRLATHKNQYRKWKEGKFKKIRSFDILQHDDHKIVLIEKYPCKSKEELYAREEYWRQKLLKQCVNKNSACSGVGVPYRGNEKNYMKKYQTMNRDKLNAYYKERYNKKKDSINERRREKYVCECGKTVSVGTKSYHVKTLFHKANI